MTEVCIDPQICTHPYIDSSRAFFKILFTNKLTNLSENINSAMRGNHSSFGPSLSRSNKEVTQGKKTIKTHTTFYKGFALRTGCERASGCWVTRWQRHQMHTSTNTVSALSDDSTKVLTLRKRLSVNELSRNGCEWHRRAKMSYKFRFRRQLKARCKSYPMT